MERLKRLVLITGAGASRNLGSGSDPLPLMEDWAKRLYEDIELVEKGAAAAMGLRPDGISSEEFEEILGAFTVWSTLAVKLNDRFRSLRD